MTHIEKLREKVELLRPIIFEAMDLLGGDAEEDLGRRFDAVSVALKTVEDEQRWIPVGESQDYPKNCDPILVVTKKKTILVARYLRERDLEKIKWEADYIPCDAFYEIDDHQKLFWQIHGVTHWRPMLESPRKKEVQE